VRNIEIKARLLQSETIHERLGATSAHFSQTLQQRDVFFAVPTGRLKLRFVNNTAELILYQRSDAATLRGSDYERVAVADGDAMLRILTQTLKVAGEVRKVRQLYLLENVRIHVDAVQGLGSYIEIEAVMDADHDEEQCHEAAKTLLAALDIAPKEYESKAYIDLLQQASQ